MKRILFLFLLIFTFSLAQFSREFSFLNPHAVYANTGGVEADGGSVEIDLSEYLKLSSGQRLSRVFDTPSSMVNLLVRVIFVGVGLILFVMVVVSGLTMIAGGTSDSKDKAKTTLTSALIGFLVIFSAYWIIQIIQVFTGINIGF
ncbi:MAG: hypothetical protein WCR60_02365 [Patescibacteria group bacterium]|jgi:hypothetical protein